MIASPTLATHYLAESDPRQDALSNHLPIAFPHSPNTSKEEIEEKGNVHPNLYFGFRTTFVSIAGTPNESGRGLLRGRNKVESVAMAIGPSDRPMLKAQTLHQPIQGRPIHSERRRGVHPVAVGFDQCRLDSDCRGSIER